MKKEFILIVDIGNSFTKIGLYSICSNKSKKIVIFKTKKRINEKEIFNEFKKFNSWKINHCILGCVVKGLKNKYKVLLKKFFDVSTYTINKNTIVSFGVEKKIKEKLGDDLMALAEYCSSINQDIVGFSFGTAIATIFIKNNKLIGVSISPGIGFSLEFFLSKIKLYEYSKISKNKNYFFGLDNKQALESGVNNLRRGYVIGIMEYVKIKYKRDFFCLITGGESFKINPVYFEWLLNPEAILLGFKYIYIVNNTKIFK